MFRAGVGIVVMLVAAVVFAVLLLSGAMPVIGGYSPIPDPHYLRHSTTQIPWQHPLFFPPSYRSAPRLEQLGFPALAVFLRGPSNVPPAKVNLSAKIPNW